MIDAVALTAISLFTILKPQGKGKVSSAPLLEICPLSPHISPNLARLMHLATPLSMQ
jgi:hypothetical protein